MATVSDVVGALSESGVVMRASERLQQLRERKTENLLRLWRELNGGNGMQKNG